ncbi:MAG: transporter substrate-binding domain-containing protein [Pseudodesulfovibrio sp.]|nr:MULTISPECIES: transporter substrate-binding domain-containing protein [Pseudodesulfovibrio]MBU4380555.1 transporter substrate-binding domain-containing protein [Pseudomonadota bacterium]MBU4474243.1 transporter substrate-binding domain-containing protein [Pseudomonadota bacterium]MBU4514633.1 transporter substrate-binding domain-containing protein [Pseudomonadota bacterium]MBU4521898.1 transporter substrate-binding domain-containing protein [Pseudomonadota bacterium]MBU4560612.1 transporter
MNRRSQKPGRKGRMVALLWCASLVLLLAPLLRPVPAHGADIVEVLSTGQSWDLFTNPDGTGLYHEILNAVFALHAIPVRHEYATSDRAEELVRLGQADMMICDDMVSPPLVMARHPMYENAYHVFFSRGRIPDWQGPQSLLDRLVLSQPGYYVQENFPVPVRIKYVANGAQGLGMVLLGRADAYVDDMAFIRKSIAENTIPFDMLDYEIRQVGVRSYHPLFNTSPRGQAIMELYDEGMRTLHQNGGLKAIYEKWGHPYPDFDKY